MNRKWLSMAGKPDRESPGVRATLIPLIVSSIYLIESSQVIEAIKSRKAKQQAQTANREAEGSHPVTNAIKVLQACIYKSVKRGLFLKSIIVPHVVKFNMLMLVFTFKHQVLQQKTMIILK